MQALLHIVHPDIIATNMMHTKRQLPLAARIPEDARSLWQPRTNPVIQRQADCLLTGARGRWIGTQ
jgi:hypothetical protein